MSRKQPQQPSISNSTQLRSQNGTGDEVQAYNFRGFMDCAPVPSQLEDGEVIDVDAIPTKKRKRETDVGGSGPPGADQPSNFVFASKTPAMRAVDIRHHQHHLPVHWIKPGQIYSGNLERRLHSEILDFVEFMEATKEELASRAKVVERFQSAIQKVTPKATLGVFGSFATGLVLAHSDIDLVILDQSKSTVSQPRAPATELKKYRNKIAEQCSGFCPILKAKVPIFNCRDYLTGFKLDISFNQANGIATVPVIQGLMTELPALRPLVMVLKQFLHCRGLDVGANGSVGGYGLTCWVAGFLRIHPDVFASRYKAVRQDAANVTGKDEGSVDHDPDGPLLTDGRNKGEASADHTTDTFMILPPDEALGILLTDFLLLFGFSFDYLKLGLAPGDSGGSWIFSKREGLGFEQGRPSEKLYIRDPQNEHSNVTASLAKIGVVTEHLAAAYDQLLAAQRLHAGETATESTGPSGARVSAVGGKAPAPRLTPERSPSNKSLLAHILTVDRNVLENRPSVLRRQLRDGDSLPPPGYPGYRPPIPNKYQRQLLQEFGNSIVTDHQRTVLLHGPPTHPDHPGYHPFIQGKGAPPPAIYHTPAAKKQKTMPLTKKDLTVKTKFKNAPVQPAATNNKKKTKAQKKADRAERLAALPSTPKTPKKAHALPAKPLPGPSDKAKK